MKRYLLLGVIPVVLIVGAVIFAQRIGNFVAFLNGYEEVPAVSTVARGDFRADISRDGSSVAWELSYANLEGEVQQAHIHFGQPGVNGGISVFLCTNLANGPAGTQPCPAPPATISGVFTAVHVIGPNAQGIAPGEYNELIRAINAGMTYANVHSTKWPGGEIRSQIRPDLQGDGGQGKHAGH